MNKTAIKNFAVWARRKLIADITIKAGRLGITENGIAEALPQSTADLKFFDIGTKDYAEISGVQVKQREALVRVIKEKERDSKSFKDAFEYVVEEVAYTWFNRLIAIRFMEVNDYLPSGIRVLSSENPSKNEPDFVTSPFETDLSFTPYEQDRVYQLKDENKWDELFRMLFIKQCNKLNEILPELFQKTEDYTELLLTISYSDTDGVIHHLVHDIDEKDFDIETIDEGTNKPIGQVEIIGWMYQYYNIEPKDKVFADLKKNIKIAKEHIPAATQLFTPDWIVRYMVENSLGRLWLEGHQNNDGIKSQWKYYLDEAEQEPAVEAELQKIRSEYANIKPEDIKIIDPCMGSGHILVYAFDVLMQIYIANGYSERDAAKSILENNLYGLDIDDRAGQLAYFAVMMKARQYNRRILNSGITPNVFSIQDSSFMSDDFITFVANKDHELELDLIGIRNAFVDAKEYGSILSVPKFDYEKLYARIEELKTYFPQSIFEIEYCELAVEKLYQLVKQAEMMHQKYDVVVTNPPYMGKKSLNNKLSAFLDKYYPNGKTELYSAFIYKCSNMTKKNGYTSMITIHTWMFISSFKKLRENIILNENIVSMLHTGAATFEELNSFNVLATAFIRKKNFIEDYVGVYVKLTDYYNTKEKIHNFNNQQNTFFAKQNKFFYIQEQPIVYWLSDHIYNIFKNTPKIESFGNLTNGLFTCDNERFVRNWFEVSVKNIKFSCHSAEEAEKTGLKWFPYAKGGNFRKWYGNNEYVVNYQNNGFEIREYRTQQGQSRKFPGEDYYFMPGITWSPFGFENFGVRYKFYGDIFDIAGSSLFAFEKQKEKYIMSFLASKIGFYFLSTVAPTVNFQIGNIGSLPLIDEQECMVNIDELASDNIEIAKNDWDSFETSWDFKKNPLI